MYKISKLILENFKFFHGKTTLNIDRQNLLIYGENGGGKSSIYWALHVFLHSVRKSDSSIQKYFDRTNRENLINRYASPDDSSSISIEFKTESGATLGRDISYAFQNTKTGEEIKLASQSCDFLNYKLLAKMYDFKNKRMMNLSSILYNEVLQYIDFEEKFKKRDGTISTTNALDWYKYLKAGLSPYPPIHTQPYKDFELIVDRFNYKMDYFRRRITQSANEYLTEKFKQPFNIYITYHNCVYNELVDVNNKKKRTRKLRDFQLNITTRLPYDNIAQRDRHIRNPHIFLNEAKLSAIALSIRFAILKEKYISKAINFLVIDDLLLSLDMSNRNVVLDILLNDFPEYQLLFFTHDRLLFEHAKHKIKSLGQKAWQYLEMYEQERDGIPKPLIIESKSYLGKAEKYFYNKEYDIAGNFLRKEIEKFCKSFLPLKLQHKQDCSLHDLNGLIMQCKDFADKSGLETDIFTALDSYRKFVLNPSSHDSYDVPKFNSEVERCIDTVKQLQKIKHKKVLEKESALEFELICEETTDTYRFEITVHSPLIWMKNGRQKSVLSVGHLNYWVFKNGIKTTSEVQHTYDTIKAMYDYNYENSDKSKSDNFWNEVIIKESGEKLKTLKKY